MAVLISLDYKVQFTPKIAQVETKLEPDTTGPTKEAVGNFETAMLEKDDHE